MYIYIQFLLIFVSLLTLIQTTQAEGLERLFTTVQERRLLDTPPPPPTDTDTKPPAPQRITFNGLVTRSDGPTTIWINDSEEPSRPGFNIEAEKREDISVPITLIKARQEIWLKPGQTLSTLDGKIFENYLSNSKSIEAEH